MDRKTIGRYQILGELGRGAMGSVLRARDPAMGREVALKCVLSGALAGDQMAEFRDRFYREARAAGALAHPGIVPVFDVGEDDGVPFLVMELVQGRTLDAALKQGERHSLERVCEIGQQLAEAMGYAHRNGVIHRDIKPANILMTSREIYGAERPRITDFGVAKLAGGEATTTGQLLGTPAYMPPEQFTGAPIDGRTDLFALGVILYRMTTGEQPFSGETLTAVSYKVVHTEPIPPSKLNPAIPPQLEAVILKCLAKSPDARYQTGDELAAALAAVRPSPRTSGMYGTISRALAAQGGAAETIDQVSSLRPKQAASTIPASALPAVSGTQSRSATPAPPPVAPYSPHPAAAPLSPVARTFAPAPPTAPPAQPRATAPPTPMPQTRPAAMPPAAPPPMRSAPPPARTYAPATPVGSTAPAASQTMRTSASSQRPNSTLRPMSASQMESSIMATRSSRLGVSKQPEEQQAPVKKRGMSVFAWLIFIALAVGGTWLFLQIRVQQAPVGAGVDTTEPAPGVAAAPVDFNPKTLDPDSNAKLSLDLDTLPSAIQVTVQMDGKTYWTGIAGDYDSYDGLMAPPGRHTLRVVVSGGGTQKASGAISGDFAAKKKMTLTVKLWPKSNGAFDPSADVVVTLQKDLFPL